MTTQTNSLVDLSVLRGKSRWHWSEYLFWLLPIAAWFLFPNSLSLLSCLLYTSPSPRDYAASRMPSSA